MKDDIQRTVTDLLAAGEYKIQDSQTIPGPGDNRLTFGNTGVRFSAVTLYIDMRGSTEVLQAHRAHNVAKIHKAYLFIATKLITEIGGSIRSYNGDSILAFFHGNGKAEVQKAITAAMQINYLLTRVCATDFTRYRPVDFGVGIDVGDILCVKAGMGRNENHNDLIWLGDAVNRATVLSDRGKGPHHIWVSKAVRELQNDAVQYGGSNRTDMWTADEIVYAGARETAFKTNYWWTVQ